MFEKIWKQTTKDDPAVASPPAPEVEPQAGAAAPTSGGPAPTPAPAPAPAPAPSGTLEERAVAAIKECYDPEIPVNIHDLGLIYGVDVSPEGQVKVTMTLTAPNCPAAQSLPLDVQCRVEAVEGVKSVEVEVVFDPPWTPDKMNDAAKLAMNIL